MTVIGQSTGTYEFPENVAVQSMRKEKGESRIGQILHFWGLIWSERKNYDAVFVHMVPLWIALGAPVWLLLRKPMYLWYEARGPGGLSGSLCFASGRSSAPRNTGCRFQPKRA